MSTHRVVCLMAALLLCAASPLFAAIQLVPIASGLSSPLFVGHAGDRSNRLFIVEQVGLILVLQPGASVPTVFLDIHTKVTSGGERGLLGKILRINVDRADRTAGLSYSIPPDNPFAGRDGRDEIFALGLRNPWRFSFDRSTGQLWVGDVGQDAREEVDAPIVRGGNYGWRVYEGLRCTNTDPSLCNPSNFIPPAFDYAQGNGRCSITGGYVYRGRSGTLPAGSYVYGDYCSGEIFVWNGITQNVLSDSTMNISSFGEDEQGELYVVDLRGSVSRIASDSPSPPAAPPSIATPPSLSPPSQNVAARGGVGTVSVTACDGCSWTAVSDVSWITITSDSSGTGTGTITYAVAQYGGIPPYRSGTVTIAEITFLVTQFR